MKNTLEGANHGLSLRIRRNYFVAELLKMVLLRSLSVVDANTAFGLYRILKSNVLPTCIINKISLQKLLIFFSAKNGIVFMYNCLKF